MSCGFLDKSGFSADVTDEVYDRLAMVYLIEGLGEYRDAQGGAVALVPGSLFFRLPDRRHTTVVYPESGWYEVFVAVRASWIGPLRECGVLGATAVAGTEELPDLPARVAGLMGRLEQAASAAELSAVEFAMADLMRAALAGELADGCGGGPGPSRDWVERARLKIEERAGSSETVEELLSGLGLSYARLRALFTRAYGVSPGEYRIRVRLDRACGLLRATRLSVSEVAARLGYSDAFAFSRQFRERMGVAPREFRKGG